jgi:hypothetical protein
MQPFTASGAADYWAGNHRGVPIAAFRRENRWHVYLDHTLQHNVLFGTAEEAVAWLTRRVDRGAASRLSLTFQAA